MDDFSAAENVGIYILRIGRFDDHNGIILVKQFQNITQIIAGTAGDENLVFGNIGSHFSIISGNRLAEKGSAYLRHISVKGGCLCLIINCLMERPDHRIAKGQGYIAHAHSEDLLAGIFPQIFICLSVYGVKQIAVLQLCVPHVRCKHISVSPS